MSKLDEAVAAAIIELHRQAKISGAATEDNGELAQVDGSFKVRPLARATLEALKTPTEGMIDAGLNQSRAEGSSLLPHEVERIFTAMIAQLLNEDRV